MSAPVCVIYNPTSGRGRGARRLDALRRGLGDRATFRPTSGPGEAETLARQAAEEGFAIVAAAGGDGTAHEVANGLMEAARPEVALAVLPVGSANDYAHSLGLVADWWRRPDPTVIRRPVDVGRARCGERQRYFINGLGLGFNGAVTLESRRIRRLRGLALYGLAFLRTLLFHFRHPRMTIQYDDEPPHTMPTLLLSLALGQREGNFTVAPEALLDDGLFDYVQAGALSRRELLSFLPGMVTGRLRSDHPQVRMGRCRLVRVHSEAPLTVHVDGEFLCRPEEGQRDLEVDLLPHALTVFARLPGMAGPPSPVRADSV